MPPSWAFGTRSDGVRPGSQLRTWRRLERRRRRRALCREQGLPELTRRRSEGRRLRSQRFLSRRHRHALEKRAFRNSLSGCWARGEQASGAPEPRAGPVYEFRPERTLKEVARQKLPLAGETFCSRSTDSVEPVFATSSVSSGCPTNSTHARTRGYPKLSASILRRTRIIFSSSTWITFALAENSWRF